ncbi:MAG: DUF192 domain-containing protein [Pseudomonadota bacterium]
MARTASARGALAALTLLFAAPALACEEDAVTLRQNGAEIRFAVEIADDPLERAEGLMHRESLPRFSGMLFIYEAPRSASFWMKNTLIPLDMLFLDATGTVRHLHENAVPLDETPIPGGDNILAVLEINGGLARQLGLGPGAEMRHPAFDPATAAWPCG